MIILPLRNFIVAAALLVSTCAAHAEKLAFQRVVELAMNNATSVGIALAGEKMAQKSYHQARSAYIPQVYFGSGLAASYGYPMSIGGSGPSIFNVNSQSLLWNPAQREFIRSARSEWNASSISTENQRTQAALEAAIAYIQLQRNTEKIQAVHDFASEAARNETIMRERAAEGLASQADVKKAALVAARARMRLTEAESASRMLRERLAQLTRLSADSIETDGTSIPAFPELEEQRISVSRAIENSPEVRIADEQAKAKAHRAKGEHKQLLPAVDLVGTYGLFSKFNNYDEFFQKFQRNNATFGVQIRFGFLNGVEKAEAEAADAEALRALKQAEAARHQVANETLRIRSAVEQLASAREVAQLEYEVAQTDFEAVRERNEAGQGTIIDVQNARIQAIDRQAAAVDTLFELEKARVQLLSVTGDLRSWAGLR